MIKKESPESFFKRRLRRCRLARGLTQAELGKKSRLQPSAINHFEAGRRRPSLINLIRLADALDVSVDYLIGRTDMESVYK